MYDNLKIFDVIKTMSSNPACVTHVREGDCGFEDLFNAYGEHKQFSLAEYEGDVYVIASGYTYVEVIDVRWGCVPSPIQRK